MERNGVQVACASSIVFSTTCPSSKTWSPPLDPPCSSITTRDPPPLHTNTTSAPALLTVTCHVYKVIQFSQQY